ncbi:DUF4968 domain-containing protein [Cohnella rhizosphaerae]|uniref:DUF4968 domain-containing protein n=1 Tax=Cohnella rhizosphaerae TaxID=1457232 RepID=A0A9X4QQK6_9BACL|nr:DUF4968 domain-containing protein [Cohnella rhizosphaerae]MDG0808136.1 DUF4968 domain-containing protein [Cohnella rhizosphaerae]
MNIRRYEARPDGLVLETSNGRMKLTPYASGTIRVQYTLEPTFGAGRSFMIVREADGAVPYTVEEDERRLYFSTSSLAIQIDKRTGAFVYRDAAGTLLAQEPARGGKSLVPVDVVRAVFDEDARLETGQGGGRSADPRVAGANRGRPTGLSHEARVRLGGRRSVVRIGLA